MAAGLNGARTSRSQKGCHRGILFDYGLVGEEKLDFIALPPCYGHSMFGLRHPIQAFPKKCLEMSGRNQDMDRETGLLEILVLTIGEAGGF